MIKYKFLVKIKLIAPYPGDINYKKISILSMKPPKHPVHISTVCPSIDVTRGMIDNILFIFQTTISELNCLGTRSY